MKFACKECGSLIDEKDIIIRSDDAGNLIPSCHNCWKAQMVKDRESFAKSVFGKDMELEHSELLKRLKATTKFPIAAINIFKINGIIYEPEKNIYRLTAKGENMKNESTFVLEKNTAIMCLYEIMSSAFCSYEGDKELFKDTSKFEDEDLLKITEDDWRDIGTPWNDLKPCMRSYFEILYQAPEEWFKKTIA